MKKTIKTAARDCEANSGAMATTLNMLLETSGRLSRQERQVLLILGEALEANLKLYNRMYFALKAFKIRNFSCVDRMRDAQFSLQVVSALLQRLDE